MEESSTYFHNGASISMSFIINAKNQGPSLEPWGTPAGTLAQSEKILFGSFTLC
jgi:hypothetical protein